MDMNFENTGFSLTLEPDLEEKQDLTPVQEQPRVEEPVLTEQERQMVEAFAEKIDLENMAQIMQYGAGTQKKMADFSDAALANVRTQDLGPVGDLIADVVGQLKGFDAQDLGPVGDLIADVVGQLKGFDAQEEKGLFGFFKKQENKLETMKNRFAKAEVNVAKIADALQEHQVRLLKDSAVLDKMYEQNLTYFKELSMYILAGKKKLQQVRQGKLLELENKAKLSGLAEDAQAARDLSEKCLRFEKKIHDLELTRAISIQTAPQIRLIQNNDHVMVEKIQTTLMNTIPLWKNQMVLALGIAHSTEAAAAQRQVADITNTLLKQNAQKLHMASVETAKEAERGIVDMQTLKETNARLLQTLDDVMKIQEEGRTKRLAAEAEMAKMEAELKNKLLQIRSGRS